MAMMAAQKWLNIYMLYSKTSEIHTERVQDNSWNNVVNGLYFTEM